MNLINRWRKKSATSNYENTFKMFHHFTIQYFQKEKKNDNNKIRNERVLHYSQLAVKDLI